MLVMDGRSACGRHDGINQNDVTQGLPVVGGLAVSGGDVLAVLARALANLAGLGQLARDVALDRFDRDLARISVGERLKLASGEKLIAVAVATTKHPPGRLWPDGQSLDVFS